MEKETSAPMTGRSCRGPRKFTVPAGRGRFYPDIRLWPSKAEKKPQPEQSVSAKPRATTWIGQCASASGRANSRLNKRPTPTLPGRLSGPTKTTYPASARSGLSYRCAYLQWPKSRTAIRTAMSSSLSTPRIPQARPDLVSTTSSRGGQRAAASPPPESPRQRGSDLICRQHPYRDPPVRAKDAAVMGVAEKKNQKASRKTASNPLKYPEWSGGRPRSPNLAFIDGHIRPPIWSPQAAISQTA